MVVWASGERGVVYDMSVGSGCEDTSHAYMPSLYADLASSYEGTAG